MTAAVFLERRQEGPLEVEADHHLLRVAATGRGGDERAEALFKLIDGCGDQGRQASGHAGPQHGLVRVVEVLGGKAGRVEIDAGEAVDLEVEEAGGDKDIAVGGGQFRPRRRHHAVGGDLYRLVVAGHGYRYGGHGLSALA